MRLQQRETKFASQEINLANTNGKYTFPNDNFLNGKTILAMWIQDNTNDDGFAPSGADLVPNACIRASILTVQKDADAKILLFPLPWLLETSGDRRMREMYITGFNPGTSYIVVQDTATFTVGESIVIGVMYQDAD